MANCMLTNTPIDNRKKRSVDRIYDEVGNFPNSNHYCENILQGPVPTAFDFSATSMMHLKSKHIDLVDLLPDEAKLLSESRAPYITPGKTESRTQIRGLMKNDFVESNSEFKHDTMQYNNLFEGEYFSIVPSERAPSFVTPTGNQNLQSPCPKYESSFTNPSFSLQDFQDATPPNIHSTNNFIGSSKYLSQCQDSLEKMHKISFDSLSPLRSDRSNGDLTAFLGPPTMSTSSSASSLFSEGIDNEQQVNTKGLSGLQVQKRFKSYHSKKWNDSLSQLRHFKAVHGHCLVPHTFNENQGLARWVKRQRRQYKLFKDGDACSTMSRERIDILNKEGFVWDSHEVVWSERFEEILKYKEQYGHCNVSCNFKENPQLGSWVKCQRRQYKNYIGGKRSSMTLDRIEKLESIGFLWEVRSSRKKSTNVHLHKEFAVI